MPSHVKPVREYETEVEIPGQPGKVTAVVRVYPPGRASGSDDIYLDVLQRFPRGRNRQPLPDPIDDSWD